MHSVGNDETIMGPMQYSLNGQKANTKTDSGYSYSPNKNESDPTQNLVSYDTQMVKLTDVGSGSLNNTQYTPSTSMFKPLQRYEHPQQDDFSQIQKELADRTSQKEEMMNSIKRLKMENEYLAQQMNNAIRINGELKQTNSEAPSASLALELESVKRQRDFFESEFRRVSRDLTESSENKGQASIEVHKAASDFKKEANTLKLQYQGDIKRLNEIVDTLKLENNGLRNLRGILEAEIEKLKDLLRESEQLKEQLSKIQIENLNLKNQFEVLTSNLKTKNEEYEKMEAQLRAVSTEKNHIAQSLKEKQTEVGVSFCMKLVLANVEIERLHSVVEQLLNKIVNIEQKYGEDLKRTEEEFRSLIESQTAERRRASDEIAELQKAFEEHDFSKQKLKDDAERMQLQVIELEKDVLHWKERYRIIESSHKYLVDAVEKIRSSSHELSKEYLPEVTRFAHPPYQTQPI